MLALVLIIYLSSNYLLPGIYQLLLVSFQLIAYDFTEYIRTSRKRPLFAVLIGKGGHLVNKDSLAVFLGKYFILGKKNKREQITRMGKKLKYLLFYLVKDQCCQVPDKLTVVNKNN